MDKLKQHWRLAAVLAFGLFYLAFWLVARDILEGGKEIESDGREEQEGPQISDVTVSLIIQSPNYTQTFREELTNQENVIDLIERVRSKGQLTYEILEYTYGTELVSVNGVVAPQGYKWNVYDDSFQIVDFTEYNLKDDGIYTIKLDFVAQ